MRCLQLVHGMLGENETSLNYICPIASSIDLVLRSQIALGGGRTCCPAAPPPSCPKQAEICEASLALGLDRRCQYGTIAPQE
jgi:hypothetical protein